MSSRGDEITIQHQTIQHTALSINCDLRNQFNRVHRIRRRRGPTALGLVVLSLILGNAESLIGCRTCNNYQTTQQWDTHRQLPSTIWTLKSAVNGDMQFTDGSSPRGSSWKTLQSLQQSVNFQLRTNDYAGALKNIELMIQVVPKTRPGSRERVCQVIDDAIQSFTRRAFSQPHHVHEAKKRITMGMQLLNLQLSSSNIVFPYNRVPQPAFLAALRALTGVKDEFLLPQGRSTDVAFRILQRLITRAGIRVSDESNKDYATLQEKDFNMVLNAYANLGRMDMAHKVVALQERTRNAPPLSPVAYSILLKGYGKLGDFANVNMILTHAKMNQIFPDQIMLNSLIDAYVNCNAADRGWEVFSFMKMTEAERQSLLNQQEEKEPFESLLCDSYSDCPQPNRRTYNTVLKGLANRGDLKKAMSLGGEMEMNGMWDAVTTNTLVHAAVMSKNLTMAEAILQRYTSASMNSNYRQQNRGGRRQYHPNVEAYTELTDAYAKSGQLTKAVKFLKFMKRRGVEPNEVTYTCVIAAFAREAKVFQAWKLIDFMIYNDLRPTYVTYNAFISGLVNHHNETSTTNAMSFDERVDQAMVVLRNMLQSGIRPNAVTVSVIVDALGRCQPSRLEEAKALCAKLERKGCIVLKDNSRVVTALVQACGQEGDLAGALDAFRTLKSPDVVAANTFLDACCKCAREKIAVETFEHFFRSKDATARMEPDVITYSILVSALLKKNTNASSTIAQKLYKEMRLMRKIQPDKTLVDIILKAIIRSKNLHESQVSLAASILRDAEALDWGEGQLEVRKRAVRSVMDGWTRGRELRDLMLPSSSDGEEREDKLFKQKGWNKVDSGFRLWGGGNLELMMSAEKEQKKDKFLESKGWNDVDSGFRII